LKYLDSSFTIDGVKCNVYPCPEMSFVNQKSLYEVLLTLGRLFYGIPRLGCYDENGIYQKNMITFDIMDANTQANMNYAED